MKDMDLAELQRRVDALRSARRANELVFAAVDAMGRGEDELAGTFIVDCLAMLQSAHRDLLKVAR